MSAQTLAYGQLPSPISSNSSPDGAVSHPADSHWAATSAHHNETITLEHMNISGGAGGSKPPSELAQRRKSHERRNSQDLGVATKKDDGSAAANGKRNVSWEPVSPGIADRSPEVVAAQQTSKSYYGMSWPTGAEAEKGRRKSSSGSSSAAAAAAATASAASSSSAAQMGAGGRRSSKAAELGFSTSGLEGGMLTMTNQEFRGLLASALRSNDIATTRHLLTTPLPKNVGTIKCFIKRHKSGLMGTFYPSYELFLEEPSKPVFMMSSKKRTKNKTSNFTVSLLTIEMLEKSKSESSMTAEDPNYLGKLRSNWSGSEYVGYDAGINPKTLIEATSSSGGGMGSRRPSETKMSNIRQELCCMTFENNILSRVPRKFTCIIPGMLPEDPQKRIVCKPLVPTDTLLYQYKQLTQTQAEKAPDLHAEQIAFKEIMILANKEPTYEPSIQAFCLNFNGRATIPSVKNFQLVNCAGNRQKNPIHLQFGKIDKDIFTMDAAYPLSLVQAFEISLAGLDTKLICD